MLELKAIFYGNVQGVGFRATAHQIANKLRLTGFAKNKTDGSVEVVAQGKKQTLEEFLKDLGRAFSNEVSKSEISFHQPEKEFSRFSIL